MKFIKVYFENNVVIIPTTRIKSCFILEENIIISTFDEVDYYLPIIQKQGKDFNFDYDLSIHELMRELNAR
jgi:hypothetical protein